MEKEREREGKMGGRKEKKSNSTAEYTLFPACLEYFFQNLTHPSP